MTTRDALKAAGWSAVWTFVALFGLSAVGWLQDVAQWASSNGADPLPGLSVLGFAAVSAVVAAVSGLVTAIVRVAQAKGMVPGQGPAYTDKRPDAA